MIRTDEKTVVVYDCGHWSSAHSDALCSRFPCTDVSILPSTSSLSGFIVVVKTRRDAAAFTWAIAVILTAVMLGVTCRHILLTG